jgi:hypothetical protein
MNEKDIEEASLVFLVIDEEGNLISVQNEIHKMTEKQHEMFTRVIAVHKPSFVLFFFLKVELLFDILSEKILNIFEDRFK